MKKSVKKLLGALLLGAALLLPALALADGPVLLVELPEDAVMVENVTFEDGDGNIVVSNSAFAEPAGGNRLSPNH